MSLSRKVTASLATEASANPAISVDHLSHRYATRKEPRRNRKGAKSESQKTDLNRPALDDVTFSVEPGEIFGILGPNGGGKTTLFRILSTMLRPVAGSQSQGSARVFGHDVMTEPELVRQQLGVVFQMASLDGKLTANENLTHQGHLYGLKGDELKTRIDYWLERFGLLDRKHSFVGQFSGGMRRRVEVAKALLHQPRLLMMDEPATGLDPGARRELWQDLGNLRQQQGVTIVLTTHLMDEAERCDRLAILSQGKLVAIDTPANLKSRIGGDVITVTPDESDASDFAADLRDAFGPWEESNEPKLVDGNIRFEKPQGAKVIAELASRFPGRAKSLMVGQPTLEDVFLHLTGSAFWQADEA